jgi:hypothetical protein
MTPPIAANLQEVTGTAMTTVNFRCQFVIHKSRLVMRSPRTAPDAPVKQWRPPTGDFKS